MPARVVQDGGSIGQKTELVLRNRRFLLAMVLLFGIPFDQTLLARTIYCEDFECKMNKLTCISTKLLIDRKTVGDLVDSRHLSPFCLAFYSAILHV